MTIRKVLIGLAALAVLGGGAFLAFMHSVGYFATTPVYQTARGAIDGYDPVAYFTEGAPRPGLPGFTHDWNGATWHFASEANLAAFRDDPGRYAPQFGGYCAWAVAHGYTAKTAPEAWHVEDGRLYLNYDLSVREQWLPRKAELIAAGLRNWPAVLKD
jgi:hypothetical protein